MVSRDSLDPATNADAIAKLLEEPPKPSHDRRWWMVSVLAVFLLGISGYALTIGFENNAELRRQVACQANINAAESQNLVTRNPANDADREAQDRLFAVVASAISDGQLTPNEGAELNQAFADYDHQRQVDDAYRQAHPLQSRPADSCERK